MKKIIRTYELAEEIKELANLPKREEKNSEKK